jgi:hypothetical protein
MSDKKDETEGNLVTAFVAARVFPKNVIKAGLITFFGSKDGTSFGEKLDELMTRDCEPYATKKRRE